LLCLEYDKKLNEVGGLIGGNLLGEFVVVVYFVVVVVGMNPLSLKEKFFNLELR